VCVRKRLRKEPQDEDEEPPAAETKRRVIKLSSIKELRAETTENCHRGDAATSCSYVRHHLVGFTDIEEAF